MSDVGYATLPIIPSLRGAQRSIENQLNGAAGSAGRTAGESAGRAFNNSFGQWARRAALGVGGALAAITGFGLKSAASLEQTRVAFTSLLGSQVAANAELKQLQAFAAQTPFSQQDVFQYAQQYFSLAGSVGLAKDQVIPFLTVVGNVGAVTGASAANIHNAVLAIAQMGSAGKVTLDNLNQVSEAFPGFNGAAAIASATGQTTAQVMKQISAGSLSATVGVQALLQGMEKFPGAANAMSKQSQTLTGLWSTFTDTLRINLTQAFQPLIPTVKAELRDLVPILTDALKTFAPALKNLLQSLRPVIGPLVRGLAAGLTAIVNALAPVFRTLAPVIKPLSDAFVQLVQAVQPLILLGAQIVSTLGPPLLTIFRELFAALAPVVQELAVALRPVLPIIAQALQQVALALQPVLQALGQAFVQVIQAIAPQLPSLATAFGNLAIALANLIVPLTPLISMFAKIQASISPVWVKVLVGAADAATLLATALGKLFGWASKLIGGAISGLGTAFSYLKSVCGPIGDVLGGIASALHEIGDVGSGIMNGLTGATNALSSATGTLGRTASDLPGVFNGIADSALRAAQAILDVAVALNSTERESEMPVGASAPTLSLPAIGGGASFPSSGGGGGVAKPAFDKSTLTSFLQTVLGTASNPVFDAVNAILKSAEASGRTFSKSFIDGLSSETSRLSDLVKQRAKVATDLAAAQQKLTTIEGKYSNEKVSVQGAFRGAFNLATAGKGPTGNDPVSIGSILAQIRQTVNRSKRFYTILKSLKGRHVPGGLLNQLALAGPAALPEAEALMSASAADLKELNSDYAALNKTSTQIGTFMANDLYGAGVNSAKGLVAGLKSQESALTKAIKALAQKMVAQLRTTLGIHSPSRIMHELGSYTGQGFHLGLASEEQAVADAANRIARAGLPASQVAAGRQAAAGQSGGHVDVEGLVAAVLKHLPERIAFDFNDREVARMVEQSTPRSVSARGR